MNRFHFLAALVSISATAYAVQITSPPGDLALTGTGFSTTGTYLNDGIHTPAKLNDGNRDGVFDDNHLYHSSDGGADGMVNFGVTLAAPASLGEVILFNRSECCGERIDGSGTKPFILTLLLAGNMVFSDKYTFTADLTDTKISGMTIDFPNVVADTVRITQRSGDYVNIAEVEAYVPEPGSLGLLGLGATGLLAHRRRR